MIDYNALFIESGKPIMADLILTHENADFDAIAAMLAAHKLNPSTVPVLPDNLNLNVDQFVHLYQNGLPFVARRDLQVKTIGRVIVVDTQRPARVRGMQTDTPLHIIDHHPLVIELLPGQTFVSEAVGAVTTLLVEQIQQQAIPLNALEATLLLLGIYEDTGSLSYGTTTARDLRAAAWLLEQKAALDTVRRFLSPPLTDQQQSLFDALVKTAETQIIEGYTVMVAAGSADHYIPHISTVAHRLRDTLDPQVLFVVVAMPDAIQLVCRSTEDSVDVGEIARLFGGGGHKRAAAATITGQLLEETVAQLWKAVYKRVRPMTRVADLMSYGAQTVDANARLNDLIRQLRRIGHEGYPVMDVGRIVGLLTRRDVDRALEHGLGNLTVRQIMSGGTVTLRPDDSVLTLEQKMVESGWGQIPVLDQNDRLIGIVTRTDLIKHWARIHPPAPVHEQFLSTAQIERVLGHDAAVLIQAVVEQAQKAGTNLYLVGGVVRDLLLDRPNLDIDFVVEDSAITLAEELQARYGGRVSSFRPFGTAKWKLDSQVAMALGISTLPDHLDFATARNEFYEHPTALPTVYNGSIKLDLHRRDFTINTLAVQLSPAASSGRILDFYGGLNDLHRKLIRVLHSLSFIDDPTRVLRAVRFEQRLNFAIEPRTDELIASSLPMLGRITGERLRNELTLLLREHEPERGLLNLQRRGVLTAIHPDFVLHDQIEAHFERARSPQLFPWRPQNLDQAELYWHVLAAGIRAERLAGVVDRLVFSRQMAQSLLGAGRLIQQVGELSRDDLRPSQFVAAAAGISELALLAAWLVVEDPLLRERIRQYHQEWRHVRTKTTGHRLREMGIPSGPCYRIVLERLRVARLDGEVRDDAEEERLLERLLNEEAVCRDRS